MRLRRETVIGGAWVMLALLALCRSRAVAAERLALPVRSAFLDPGACIPGLYPAKRRVTEADVRAKVDAMAGLGIETLVITYVEYVSNTWGAFYPSSLPELTAYPNLLGFDLVGAVMEQAGRNGQSVMLGIGRGPDPRLTYDGCSDPTRLAAALSLAGRVIAELHREYAVRHESFGGWYLTHECRDLGYASAYYDRVADVCHGLTPGKPVMVAPDGAPVADAGVIAASRVDIFAYQDAVGAGFVPPPEERYSFLPERRLAEVGAAFGRYSEWHAGSPGKRIWADVELWQMDGPEYTKAYPAEWARVARQIEAVSPHVSGIIFYEVGGFLEDPANTAELGGPRAVQLFRDYRRALEALGEGGADQRGPEPGEQ